MISLTIKKEHPKFKSKWHSKQTLTVPQNAQFKLWRINNKYAYVKLAKLDEPVKVRLDRKFPSKPSSLTIIKNSDMTFEISFVVEKTFKKKQKTKNR